MKEAKRKIYFYSAAGQDSQVCPHIYKSACSVAGFEGLHSCSHGHQHGYSRAERCDNDVGGPHSGPIEQDQQDPEGIVYFLDWQYGGGGRVQPELE